ncbi:MAG: RES family NAD+ phosphorylase [Candidatus Nanopelagicales bacterium]
MPDQPRRNRQTRPSPVWRVARRADPLAFSRIAPEDAWTDAGNRFDIPGAGVLYAADTVRGCYVETLARFRPSPRILAEIAHDGDYMNAGAIPAAWREDRVLAQITVDPDGPAFVDIDTSRTLTHLAGQPELRTALDALGVTDLDRGALYTSNRRVTRLLALWIYAQTDDTGTGRYAGLRYQSRLGKQHTCWAIFEDRTTLTQLTYHAITRTDLDLKKVADNWSLTIH